jgi:ferredoxin--NADP+ reductase
MSGRGDNGEPLRVAIVGSGPAGFYAAEALLAHPEIEVAVDMIDRLPTPFGLVRAGVAPDHPKIKNVIKRYEKTAGHDAYRFFGHVTVGRDIAAAELAELYDAVVWAYGAGADRRLGIPGEDLPGSHAATEFVAWYNGHPDYADRRFDLDCERVVVIGNGNVAADVARMLVLPRDELEVTDTADHAIEALARSKVREVVVLGRRGPAQAAFTNPEVRELGELTDADVLVDPAAVEIDEATAAFLESDADVTNRKNLETFTGFAERAPAGKPKRVELRFLRTPLEIQGNGHVERIVVAVNELHRADDGSIRPRTTEATETIECGMVLRSIGYLGTGIDGLPYDANAGVIPNEGGRVLGDAGEAHFGHYVVGWIKRGPSGVIGTNKKDAQETIGTLLGDAAAGRLSDRGELDPDGLARLLTERGVDYVEYDGWQAIDALEQQRGAAAGRPRVKLTAFEDMLEAARKDGDG